MIDLKDLINKGKTVKSVRVLSATRHNHIRKIIKYTHPQAGINYDQWAVVRSYSSQHMEIVKICPTRRSAGYHFGRCA